MAQAEEIHLELKSHQLSCELMSAFPEILKFKTGVGVAKIPLEEFHTLRNRDLFLGFEVYPTFLKSLIEISPDLILASWHKSASGMTVEREWHDSLSNREPIFYHFEFRFWRNHQNEAIGGSTTYTLAVPISMISNQVYKDLQGAMMKSLAEFPNSVSSDLQKSDIHNIRDEIVAKRIKFTVDLPQQTSDNVGYLEKVSVLNRQILEFIGTIGKD